jgi:hypothetical protein
MLKILAIAATLTAPTATPAPPPPSAPHCITRQQVSDMAVVSIAAMVESLRTACQTHLAPTAWLATPAAAEFSARLRGEAERRFESALTGIAGMFGGANIPPETVQSFRRELFSDGSATEFARLVNPAICSDANEMFEIGSTLSPDQMGRFFGAFASLVDNFIRIVPPGGFGPNPTHRPAAPPAPRAPGATPASFDLAPRTPAAPPAAEAPPVRPFMCRDSG